jgi:hypothetical protein
VSISYTESSGESFWVMYDGERMGTEILTSESLSPNHQPFNPYPYPLTLTLNPYPLTLIIIIKVYVSTFIHNESTKESFWVMYDGESMGKETVVTLGYYVIHLFVIIMCICIFHYHVYVYLSLSCIFVFVIIMYICIWGELLGDV